MTLVLVAMVLSFLWMELGGLSGNPPLRSLVAQRRVDRIGVVRDD